MEETLLYSLVSLAFIFFIVLKLFPSRILKRKKNLPPSPPSVPILGHLHLVKQPLHRALHALSSTHGPIISLRFGSRLVVLVSSPPLVEECITKYDVIVSNRPKLLMGKYLGYNYTSMVHSPYGDHWRNLRRIGATEIFATGRLNAFSSIRKDEVERLLLKLRRNDNDQNIVKGGFKKVELKSMFQELNFNIMMRMVAGKRYYGDEVSDLEEAKKFREMMTRVASYGGASNRQDFLPILKWIDGGSFERGLKAFTKRVDEFLQGLIDERRRSNEEQKNTMIDHLLSLQETQPEYYTDEIIKGFIMVILVAGTDTSSATLEWTMSNLLNHPDILSKAREEIDTQIGLQHPPDETDMSKLPYLRNIISETLRLYPPGPLLVPRAPSADCTLGGYDVPRDTVLLVNAWAIHRDPSFWDDPTSFKPNRFDTREAREANYKLMPFGLGRRTCPGSGLADRIVSLTLGSLIQSFEWERVDENAIDMTEKGGTALTKMEPLQALCKERSIINKNLI